MIIWPRKALAKLLSIWVLKCPKPQNFFHFCEKDFGPRLFLSMLYPFKARKLGSSSAHGPQYRRIGLVLFVTSSRGFIRPRNNKQWEIAKSNHFFPSSHSLQEIIVKKGILCKAFHFLSHFCSYIQKQYTNQAFCKKRKRSPMFVCFVWFAIILFCSRCAKYCRRVSFRLLGTNSFHIRAANERTPN